MSWQEIFFLSCLGFGLIYTLIVLFAGDFSGHFMGHVELPVLHPLSWVSGLTSFGGIGFLLVRLTRLSTTSVFLLAIAGGILLAVAAYFVWIKPMSKAEASTGYTMRELEGRIGEVSVTIPANGYGEVLISMVNGTTNHIAASLEQTPIKEGNRVVVVQVKENILYVVHYS